MTLGQMSEIGFMLVMPLFFRRLGVKKMLLVGMAAWATRYLLFAYGDNGGAGVDALRRNPAARHLLRLLLRHRADYVDQKAPPDLRAAAQGLIAFVTLGLGCSSGHGSRGESSMRSPCRAAGMRGKRSGSCRRPWLAQCCCCSRPSFAPAIAQPHVHTATRRLREPEACQRWELASWELGVL